MNAAQPNKARRAFAEPTVPRTTPFRHPRLGLGRPTNTLVQHLPVSRHGAHELEVSVTSDRHGQQQLARRLIYAMLLTPATPPQTLTRPSLLRHAYATLPLSFDYVQVPSVVTRLPS